MNKKQRRKSKKDVIPKRTTLKGVIRFDYVVMLEMKKEMNFIMTQTDKLTPFFLSIQEYYNTHKGLTQKQINKYISDVKYVRTEIQNHRWASTIESLELVMKYEKI